jgi:hypothetical protein
MSTNQERIAAAKKKLKKFKKEKQQIQEDGFIENNFDDSIKRAASDGYGFWIEIFLF